MSAQVVVVGAGYAGLSAARRLRRGGADVTVVNPRAEFVERIRLHQLVAGNHTATRPLTSLLAPGTGLVHDRVGAIDARRRTVTLGGGDTLGYDYLVYAVGSRGRLDVVPGAGEHAVAVGSLDDAIGARARLAGLPRGSSITVVGAGLTGVELAAELAEPGTHAIRLVSAGPLAPSVGDRGRDQLRGHFARLGVQVLEHAAVTEVHESKIALVDGRTLDSDLTMMTAMVELPALAGDSGLPVDRGGALRVDDTLVSVGAPTVIGAGDAARIDGHPLRMSCQAAIPLGAHAAETVLHLHRGGSPKPVRPKFTGQCISLGRRSGLFQHATTADAATSLTLTGRAAAFVKEQVCASTLRFGLNPRLASLSYSWT